MGNTGSPAGGRPRSPRWRRAGGPGRGGAPPRRTTGKAPRGRRRRGSWRTLYDGTPAGGAGKPGVTAILPDADRPVGSNGGMLETRREPVYKGNPGACPEAGVVELADAR